MCRGQTIAQITVRTRRSGDLDTNTAISATINAVGGDRELLRRTTNPDVVRRFLLLHEGQPCDEFRRSESERILRAQPYLADAHIRVFTFGRDSVRLDVATEDELRLAIGGRLQHGTLGRVRLGNTNIAGRALAITMQYERGFGYRDGFGVRFADYQAFGRAWVMNLEAIRDPLGGSWVASLREPVYTELHPHSWYLGFVNRASYEPLQHGTVTDLAARVERTQWLATTAWRLGRPRRAVHFGPLLLGERSSVGPLSTVTDSGIVQYAGSEVAANHDIERARVGAIAGYRRVDFVPARGFDALTGSQDLVSGSQAIVFAARSIGSVDGLRRHNVLVGTAAYAGHATPHSLMAVQIQGETQVPAADRAATFASGRVAWYGQPSVGRLHVVSAEYSGSWHSGLPLQVTLSSDRNGMAAFAHARVGGAHRLITRIEERLLLGAIDQAEFGGAAFLQAGRLWAGDAPFGVTTPVQLSAGISLLAAFPRGSKRTWRADLAVPFTHAGHPARIELRAAFGDRTRSFWHEPDEFLRAREGSLLARMLAMP